MVLITQFHDALPRLSGRCIAPPRIVQAGAETIQCNNMLAVQGGEGLRVGLMCDPDHDHVTLPTTPHVMLLMPPTPGVLMCGKTRVRVV